MQDRSVISSITSADVTDGGGAVERCAGTWHVARVCCNAERTVCRRLVDAGIEAYVPVMKKRSHRRDRITFIDSILISMYVFFRCGDDRIKSIYRFPGIVDILRCAGTTHYAVIPDTQIDSLKILCANAAESLVFKPGQIRPGTRIVISHGRLKGVTGEILSTDASCTSLCVRIDMLGCAVVNVPVDWCVGDM